MALDTIEQITEHEHRINLMENFNAGRIMNSSIQTTAPTATLTEAARQMIDQDVSSLPVVEQDDLVGIITKTDILRACFDTFSS